MAKKQSLRERVARMLCEWRGVDPDAPVTIGKPAVEITDEGGNKRLHHPGPEHHPVAWKGYAPLADKIIKAVKRAHP